MERPRQIAEERAVSDDCRASLTRFLGKPSPLRERRRYNRLVSAGEEIAPDRVEHGGVTERVHRVTEFLFVPPLNMLLRLAHSLCDCLRQNRLSGAWDAVYQDELHVHRSVVCTNQDRLRRPP